MDLSEIMRHRRSVRRYTGEELRREDIERIARAGLTVQSGRGRRPWEIIVVTDKESLIWLSDCRVNAAKMLQGAGAAFVVVADPSKSDTWIEDCSCVMSHMHLMADSLGLGSCWIQCRMREAANGMSTDEYVRNVAAYPKDYTAEAILSVGVCPEGGHPGPHEELPVEKIHYGRF